MMRIPDNDIDLVELGSDLMLTEVGFAITIGLAILVLWLVVDYGSE